jgi:hypothetical protein
MSIDKKIIEELNRYRTINKYIMEQDVPPPPGGDVPPPPGGDVPPPPGGDVPPPPAGGDAPVGDEPTPVDVENDPDVEKIDNKGESEDKEGDEESTEELDVTELVSSQKEIAKKQDDYFEELFAHIERLESKLGEMDNLVNKINSLEATIEKTRPKTPQEKLELRSLDSGPYNQKLTDFFVDKEQEMQKTGKNEYILTTDDVDNFSPSDIRTSFNPEGPNKNFGI